MKKLEKTFKSIQDDLYIFIEYSMRQYHLGNSEVLDDARVEIQGNIFSLIFPSYIEYINSGRRAGAKMPPSNAIIAWCRVKGIPTDNNTIWRIRQGIAKQGIAARPVLDQIFDLAEHEWMTDWSDKLFNEIIEELVEWF